MKKLLLVATALLFAMAGSSQAQNNSNILSKCGFDQRHRELMKTDPDYARKTEEFNQALLNAPQVQDKQMPPVYQVPVVVHVMHLGSAEGSGYNISDDDIKAGIRLANERFRRTGVGFNTHPDGADVEVEFALAVRDPSGNCTDGIVRVDMSGYSSYAANGVGSGGMSDGAMKAVSRWNPTEYYNIYIVSEIDGSNCFTGGGYTAGYAYLAGSHGGSVDGIVALSCSFTSGSTLAHELGHAMNLYHTFEGGSCSESSCSTQGDLCCDTPPHPGNNNSCFARECSNTQQIENYMDYTGDACQNMFTNDQTTRVRAALTGTRASFLESNGNMALVPPGAPSAGFTSTGSVICSGATVQFYDNSACTPNSFQNSGWSTISFNWTFDDGVNTPITSTSQNPEITFNTNGSYDVSLEVTNSNGTSTYTENDFIVVSAAPSLGSCSPGIQNVGYFAYSISNVAFNNILNPTSITENGNQDYTCEFSTVVYRDSTYDLSIEVAAGGSQTAFYAVYIDYNNNGTLGDAGEMVMSGSLPSSSAPTTIAGTVTIPSTATQFNSLRMRVINDQFDLSGPCDNLFTGESEDYTVYIGEPSSSNLPINLLSFNAAKTAQKATILNWVTAQEENFSHFEIEHSTDLKNFRKLESVQGKGSLEKKQSYRYEHQFPTSGVNYYRLKLVDKDGKFEYSPVRQVNLKESDIKLTPNPFHDRLAIRGVDSDATMQIVNLIGEVVISENLPAGSGSVATSSLPSGTYMVIIRTENGVHTEKLIKANQ